MMRTHFPPYRSPRLDECAAQIAAAIRAHWRREITFAKYTALCQAIHAAYEPDFLAMFASAQAAVVTSDLPLPATA